MRSRYFFPRVLEKKFKEGEFFNELAGFIVNCRFECIYFFKYYREASLLFSSRYKNSKRQNFLIELTGFGVYCRFEFICFFANNYREASFNEFSIQKFEETEFFNELT
jgi:hypothetical protein